MATPRIQVLRKLVHQRTANDDISHDTEHVERVVRWAIHLAQHNDVNPELAECAGLVHDLVNVPKESSERALGSEKSAVAGRELLEQSGFDENEVSEIVEAVRTCSWSRGLAPTNSLGAVLQDADRIDAMGAIGIARNFACAQSMAARGSGSRLFDPNDPTGLTARDLDDVRNAADHYRIKLLRLKNGMKTKIGRHEAALRHAFMEQFLLELQRETHGP